MYYSNIITIIILFIIVQSVLIASLVTILVPRLELDVIVLIVATF